MARPTKTTKASSPGSTATTFTHTNRRGDTYYLHEGQTKTGKPRYFVARTPGVGALAAVPDGFEITESINGVVSVRRIGAPIDPIPASDLRVVESELARHPHLRHHKVQAASGEILIYAPDNSPDMYLDHGILDLIPFPSMRERAVAQIMARSRYSPVMKFVREDSSYSAMRMTYRGKGGWSWPLATGTIAVLVKRFVGPIGTDAFFELC